jgi:release factor glutamine methyltransferase
MTVQAAQAWGTQALASRPGQDSPGLDASLLLAETLGIDRAHLILAYPTPLQAEDRRRFEALIRRRLAGEPVAYILGRKEFWGLEFTVGPPVLVPRPDTETLVEAALAFLASRSLSGPRAPLLDLCTGSGAVAIALKHESPGLEVWASDISPEALDMARHNAARLLDAGGPAPLRLVQSDLFEGIPGRFGLITANPPYVETGAIPGLPAEVREEPRLALDGGAEGLDLIRRIIAEAPAHLYAGGGLLLEADPRQMGRVRAELEKQGFGGIQIHKDLSGAERVIGGYRQDPLPGQ